MAINTPPKVAPTGLPGSRECKHECNDITEFHSVNTGRMCRVILMNRLTPENDFCFIQMVGTTDSNSKDKSAIES